MIVSGAVEGLKASDVVLVDHEGTLLAGGEDEEGGWGMPSALNLRSAEERRPRPILDALTRVLGSPRCDRRRHGRGGNRLGRPADPFPGPGDAGPHSETIREEKSESADRTASPARSRTSRKRRVEPTDSRRLPRPRAALNQHAGRRAVQAPGTVKRVSVGCVNSEILPASQRRWWASAKMARWTKPH